MKKITIFIIIIAFILLLPKMNVESLIIPKESIRVRIIANSNNETDQQMKTIVRKNIEEKLAILLKNSSSIDTSRKIINDNLDLMNDEVKKTLEEHNYPPAFSIDYGIHYFPEKIYKGVTYESGNYESLVVTLGKGEGTNWWCVLFPPLCLMEAEENDNVKDVEYQFFVKKIIDKYFK